MPQLTNEQTIELFPSKALRDYLTKIEWEFSEHERHMLYNYLVLKEKPSYRHDYVTIPYPFRSGDLVYVIGEESRIGVFASAKDDSTFFELDVRIRAYADWSDSGCSRVEFLEKNGIFRHEHPYVYNLEYAKFPEESEEEKLKTRKDNPYKCALETASELLRGTDSSIECLQMYCREYAKNINS